MRNYLFIIITCVFVLQSKAQTIEEYYRNKDYKEVIKFEKNAEKLTPEQLYFLGYAFFQSENDEKAIKYYDKAIEKGLNEPYIHYYKALSLRYSKQSDAAVKEFDEALKLDPDNQEYMSEKALVYYYNKDYDKALEIFEKAKNLPNTFYAPHYMIPHILNIKGEYDTALKGLYAGLKFIDEGNEYYVSSLLDIGRLEFTHTKNYILSAQAYKKAIELDPKNYDVYPKLMKTYNANNQLTEADSVFAKMKVAYENNELPKDYMEYGNTPIAEFEWKGQTISVYKYFKAPTELLQPIYKAYLLTKEGDKVERTFLTEKTIVLEEGGANHLFCEKIKGGGHRTFPYGWNDDKFSVHDFRKAVFLVLEGKMDAAASSTPGK